MSRIFKDQNFDCQILDFQHEDEYHNCTFRRCMFEQVSPEEFKGIEIRFKKDCKFFDSLILPDGRKMEQIGPVIYTRQDIQEIKKDPKYRTNPDGSPEDPYGLMDDWTGREG